MHVKSILIRRDSDEVTGKKIGQTPFEGSARLN